MSVQTRVEDSRFTAPLYSVSDAALYLKIPRSTFGSWVDGRPDDSGAGGLITTVRPRSESRGEHRIPFIGIAEGYVLSAFRRAGVSLQRIRPSLDALRNEIGRHALASDRLFTDGVEVLWNEAAKGSPEEIAAMQLLVPRTKQYVFNDVVAQYLHQIAFSEGYARLIRLQSYGDADVVLDPVRGYGRPIFDQAGVAVENVFGALAAGDSIEATALDYGLEPDQLRNAWSLSLSA